MPKETIRITWERDPEWGGELTVIRSMPGDANIDDMLDVFASFLVAAEDSARLAEEIRTCQGAEE